MLVDARCLPTDDAGACRWRLTGERWKEYGQDRKKNIRSAHGSFHDVT